MYAHITNRYTPPVDVQSYFSENNLDLNELSHPPPSDIYAMGYFREMEWGPPPLCMHPLLFEDVLCPPSTEPDIGRNELFEPAYTIPDPENLNYDSPESCGYFNYPPPLESSNLEFYDSPESPPPEDRGCLPPPLESPKFYDSPESPPANDCGYLDYPPPLIPISVFESDIRRCEPNVSAIEDEIQLISYSPPRPTVICWAPKNI